MVYDVVEHWNVIILVILYPKKGCGVGWRSVGRRRCWRLSRPYELLRGFQALAPLILDKSLHVLSSLWLRPRQGHWEKGSIKFSWVSKKSIPLQAHCQMSLSNEFLWRMKCTRNALSDSWTARLSLVLSICSPSQHSERFSRVCSLKESSIHFWIAGDPGCHLIFVWSGTSRHLSNCKVNFSDSIPGIPKVIVLAEMANMAEVLGRFGKRLSWQVRFHEGFMFYNHFGLKVPAVCQLFVWFSHRSGYIWFELELRRVMKSLVRRWRAVKIGNSVTPVAYSYPVGYHSSSVAGSPSVGWSIAEDPRAGKAFRRGQMAKLSTLGALLG